MQCPGCGKSLAPDDQECPHCGLRLPARPQGDSGPSCLIMIAIAVFCLAAAGFSILKLIDFVTGGF